MPVAAAGTEVPAPPPPYRCTEGAGTSGRPEHTGNPNPTPFLRERTTSYAVSPRPTHKTTTPPLPSPLLIGGSPTRRKQQQTNHPDTGCNPSINPYRDPLPQGPPSG